MNWRAPGEVLAGQNNGYTAGFSPLRIGVSIIGVAVGTSIAARPPRRSVRAELPHTAPPLDTSVEANIGIRMKSTGTRNPSLEDRPQMVPVWLSPLTAPA